MRLEQDVKCMQRALELARLGVGLTRPNPPVGAVLVRDGVVLSEGWHRFAGGDHAERACLQQVEGPLGDATLYVTLEPLFDDGKNAALYRYYSGKGRRASGGGDCRLQSCSCRPGTGAFAGKGG
jgi:pyrimidine deaminase RibD-like protein